MDQYVGRRYGAGAPPAVAACWRTLAATVYSCLDGTVDHVRLSGLIPPLSPDDVLLGLSRARKCSRCHWHLCS